MFEVDVIEMNGTITHDQFFGTFFIDNSIDSVEDDGHLMCVTEDPHETSENATNIPELTLNSLRILED